MGRVLAKRRDWSSLALTVDLSAACIFGLILVRIVERPALQILIASRTAKEKAIEKVVNAIWRSSASFLQYHTQFYSHEQYKCFL